jgi:hypothetical protein
MYSPSRDSLVPNTPGRRDFQVYSQSGGSRRSGVYMYITRASRSAEYSPWGFLPSIPPCTFTPSLPLSFPLTLPLSLCLSLLLSLFFLSLSLYSLFILLSTPASIPLAKRPTMSLDQTMIKRSLYLKGSQNYVKIFNCTYLYNQVQQSALAFYIKYALFSSINNISDIVDFVESLQSHFILTMSHWSSSLPVCFPSQGTQVQIPRGVLVWNRDSPVSGSRYIGVPDVIDHHWGLVWGGPRPKPSLGPRADNVIIPLDLTQLFCPSFTLAAGLPSGFTTDGVGCWGGSPVEGLQSHFILTMSHSTILNIFVSSYIKNYI